MPHIHVAMVQQERTNFSEPIRFGCCIFEPWMVLNRSSDVLSPLWKVHNIYVGHSFTAEPAQTNRHI